MCKRILITGITGFLGSNLANVLSKFDYSPLIVGCARSKLRDYDAKKVNLDGRFIIHYGDIKDYHFIDSLINKYEIEGIYHTASNAIVRTCDRSPIRCFESNIMGTINILESARQNKTVKFVVICSSDKYYGQTKELPYFEDMCPNPSGIYETSKTCADFIARSYYKTYNLPTVVIRSANMFGGGDLNFSRIVPNSCRQILVKNPPIIWSDVAEYKREFIYVNDVISAIISLADAIHLTKGEAYNIGSGEVHKIKDFVSILCKASGNKISPIFPKKEIYFQEIPNQHLSITKIEKTIGWTAKETKQNFYGCLKSTYNWYKNYFEDQR